MPKPHAIDPEFIAAQQSVQAHLLSVLSQAMSLDLAVTPIIVASEVGIGVSTMTTAFARALFMECAEIRCGEMEHDSFVPQAVLRGGDIQHADPHGLAILRSILGKGIPSLIVLDEVNSLSVRSLEHVLGIIQTLATASVIVVFRTSVPPTRTASDDAIGHGRRFTIKGVDPIEHSLIAVEAGLGIHRAHIPTAILSITNALAGINPEQPLLLAGSVEFNSSKIGERYLYLNISEPYDHQAHLTVYAEEGQDDDGLNDAIYPILSHRGEVAVRCRKDQYGGLVADIRDFDLL